jgi:hypothetical protein
MRSSSVAMAAVALAAIATMAHAQPVAPGFAVERLDLAPAGAGWFAMDELNMQPGLGGALSLSLGYEVDPLRVDTPAGTVAVVSDRTFAEISGAITYDWFRVSLAIETEIEASGDPGSAGGFTYAPPAIALDNHPDSIADPRFGVDARLVGSAGDPFRFGVSGELYLPNGSRADYDSDGSVRGVLRALVAGDVRAYRYAGYLGVNIRPLDDATVPNYPRGSELVFGVAGGVSKLLTCWRATVGPELFGATAFNDFAAHDATALEAMLSGRLEQIAGDGRRIRLKLGIGAGIVPELGAPAFRVLAGIEMFGQPQRTKPRPATN